MQEQSVSTKPKNIARHTTSGGVRIYCIPIQSFPGHYTNVYLVLADEKVVLIDLGSGWGDSNNELIKGIEEVRRRFGEKVTPGDIELLLFTHGHIDHFGSLSFFRTHSRARVGIHELDARQIINLEETILVMARNVRLFLDQVGISESTRNGLMGLYKAGKNFLCSETVDFFLNEEEEPIEGMFRIFHTPGHCPGEVCIQVDDVLFAGDHLLSDITPHQAPEAIARYTGLGHYLASLKKIKSAVGLSKALGGHQSVIEDPYGRIEAIEAFHRERLDEVLGICRERQTIKEISSRLFHKVSGYEVLLALEETAAHVEYLYHRGRLAIDNLEDFEKQINPVLYYRTR